MSSAAKYQPHYTVDDYQHWQGDWELWNGVAIAMGPSPFGRHAQLVGQLAKILGVGVLPLAVIAEQLCASLNAHLNCLSL